MRSLACLSVFALGAVLASGGSCPPLACAADDKPVVVKVGKLSAAAPAEWKTEKPKYTLRSYQFRLPGPDGMPDGELAVYPESNPGVEKTFARWKATFVPPEGKTADDISKTSKFDLPGAKVDILDVSGTWRFRERPQDPKSKEVLLEDYRVVWVIVAEKDEATHIRLSGPRATVEKYYPGFEKWVKALK